MLRWLLMILLGIYAVMFLVEFSLGIIVGGGLVYLLKSSYPDLIIGLIISVIVTHGGLQIMREANKERQLN